MSILDVDVRICWLGRHLDVSMRRGCLGLAGIELHGKTRTVLAHLYREWESPQWQRIEDSGVHHRVYAGFFHGYYYKRK